MLFCVICSQCLSWLLLLLIFPVSFSQPHSSVDQLIMFLFFSRPSVRTVFPALQLNERGECLFLEVREKDATTGVCTDEYFRCYNQYQQQKDRRESMWNNCTGRSDDDDDRKRGERPSLGLCSVQNDGSLMVMMGRMRCDRRTSGTSETQKKNSSFSSRHQHLSRKNKTRHEAAVTSAFLGNLSCTSQSGSTKKN